MPYMVIVSSYGVERDCRKEVKDLGFTCYQPTYREQIVKRGRKIWEERLLFGRYFFAQWREGLTNGSWRDIFQLRTVAGIMMRVDAPSPELVRDWEIEKIRAMESPAGHVIIKNGEDRFRIGQRVCAAVGVLAGNQGSYAGAGRGGCEVALLDLFGRETRIEFAPGVLRAA